MTNRVHIKFTRVGDFKMTGGLSVEVENPADWEEVLEKAKNREWKEFLPTDIMFDDDEWFFEPLEEQEPEVAND